MGHHLAAHHSMYGLGVPPILTLPSRSLSMEWFSTLYEPDQGPLFEERALNLARDAATLRHFAQRAPLGGVGGDPEGLRGALDGVLQRFPPEVGRGARLRAAEFDSNKPAQRAATLLSGTAKCFVAAWAGLRAGGRGALPHVAAAALPAAEAAAAGGDGDPLVLSIGDVLAIDGGEGSTYYGVVVQLWDPQAAQATYARGVAARLWDAAEFEAAGQHAAAAQLAEAAPVVARPAGLHCLFHLFQEIQHHCNQVSCG